MFFVASMPAPRDYTCNQPEEILMGLSSLLRFFLPQDDKFLPLFEQSADNLRDAVQVYASLGKAASRDDIVAVRDKI